MRKYILSGILLAYSAILAFLPAQQTKTLIQNDRPVTYKATYGQETTLSVSNPYRGFLHIYGFTLSEEAPSAMAEQAQKYLDANRLPLMQIQVNLRNYSNVDLSENALAQLNTILSTLSGGGRQLILRFLYDTSGNAVVTEPMQVSQILRHMEQVAPTVNQYASSVFLIQGAFTGNYGEMAGTRFGSFPDIQSLIGKLSEVIDPSIFLSVRTPSQLRGVTGTRETPSPETAYDGSLPSRLGLFNDGMMGSSNDLGTYDDTPNAGTSEPEDKGTREEEITFQDTLCQYVPNGGEVVMDTPFNDLDAAIPTLQAMHISYLNADYDAAALDKWKNSSYQGMGCFDGRSGYAYIQEHLGYRYVLHGSSLTHEPFAASPYTLSLQILNTGFAPAYRKFDATLVLTDEETGAEHPFPAEMDNRTIQGGTLCTFELPLDLSELPEGDYRVTFFLTDPATGKRIQFAGDNASLDGSNEVGTLSIGTVSLEEFLSDFLAHLRNR